ncbi:hypothetical protein H4R34_004305 [Dimargaris verticillata]|uniref:FAD-binding FR-type domain-containing protein n=1 Tax=Dimargaris verticillata TaxID=2761393 RepID=A0A9W8B5U8_9FUNG|nr:hypothetical protein H4R34_004305 [Dimargaris verticillata]
MADQDSNLKPHEYLEDVDMAQFVHYSVSPATSPPMAQPTDAHLPVSTAMDQSQLYRNPSSASQGTIVDGPNDYMPPYMAYSTDVYQNKASAGRHYLHGRVQLRSDRATVPPTVAPARLQSRHGMLAVMPDFSLERMVFYTLWVLLQLIVFLPVIIQSIVGAEPGKASAAIVAMGAIGRAAAMCLNFDSAFILLLVCRNVLSVLRATLVGRVLTLDKNIHAHKVAGWTIMIMTAVHVVAHYAKSALYQAKEFSMAVYMKKMIVSEVGGTGHLLILALVLMVITAIARVRRTNFELFYYTHHLFIAYYILCIMHGYYVDGGGQKGAWSMAFWKFFLVPGFLYLAERIAREVRGRQATNITRVVQHPSRVVQIQFKKEALKPKTGQYVYLCCPDLSWVQWHPFTLTSAPEDDYISVHIRVVGDWTQQLADRLGCDFSTRSATSGKRYNPIRQKTLRRKLSTRASLRRQQSLTAASGKTMVPTVLPRLLVDGPYGTPTEHVFDYEVAVLVGAGIGVTPYASILKSLWHRVTQPGKMNQLRKVYFMWICRDIQAFEWFQDLLVALEQEDLGDFLEVRAYLTGKLSEDQIRNLAIRATEDGPDALTGRKNPTFYGRPNFDQTFAEIAWEQPKQLVGVFCCGPRPVATTIRQVCKRFSANQGNELGTGTSFAFHKEHF